MQPILPMRPTFAGILKTEDDLRTVLSIPNVVIQPKLGGDRVTLHRTSDSVCAFNRKGEPYKFSVNHATWMSLPIETILDGEVYGGHFHTFDCIRIGGKDYSSAPCFERVLHAEHFANSFGCGFIFKPRSFEWYSDMMEQNAGLGQRMMWEGVVVKDANSPYVPLANCRHESYTWRKFKWL